MPPCAAASSAASSSSFANCDRSFKRLPYSTPSDVTARGTGLPGPPPRTAGASTSKVTHNARQHTLRQETFGTSHPHPHAHAAAAKYAKGSNLRAGACTCNTYTHSFTTPPYYTHMLELTAQLNHSLPSHTHWLPHALRAPHSPYTPSSLPVCIRPPSSTEDVSSTTPAPSSVCRSLSSTGLTW